MRILFSAPAGHGQSLPMVPLAMALRAAGHDIVLATTGRGKAGLRPVTATGLPVVDVAPGLDADSVFERFTPAPSRARSPRDVAFAVNVFAELARLVSGALLEFAHAWQPDIVVHPPLDGAAPLAAVKFDIPAVRHAIGFAETPRTGFLIAAALGETFAPPALALDVTPPSLRLGSSMGLPMRYVADFVPGGDTAVLLESDVPALSGCDAVVHRGGAAITLAALASGVAQAFVPRDEDNFVNTEAVVRGGAGLVGLGAVDRLRSIPLRRAARRIAAEMASMPPPSRIVPLVEGLISG